MLHSTWVVYFLASHDLSTHRTNLDGFQSLYQSLNMYPIKYLQSPDILATLCVSSELHEVARVLCEDADATVRDAAQWAVARLTPS